jgi:hypothetical protein
MMKRISGLLLGATLLSLAFASIAFAQQTAGGIVVRQERIVQGPEGGPPPPPDANVVFFATESFGGKVVKGAPTRPRQSLKLSRHSATAIAS